MAQVSPDDLIAYAKVVEGQNLYTVTGKLFTVKVDGDSLVFTPKSTKKPRSQNRKIMQKICDVYASTKSLRPKDYLDKTQNASYTLVLIGHAKNRQNNNIPMSLVTPVGAASDGSEPPLPHNLPETVLRAIKERRGQPEFRAKLIGAYGGKCAITDCDAVPALEASHIVGYAETGSHAVTNGLLLRADIHTLFDCGLIRIDPDSLRVVLSPELKGTMYDEIDGKSLRQPANPQDVPSTVALRQRWQTQQTTTER